MELRFQNSCVHIETLTTATDCDYNRQPKPLLRLQSVLGKAFVCPCLLLQQCLSIISPRKTEPIPLQLPSWLLFPLPSPTQVDHTLPSEVGVGWFGRLRAPSSSRTTGSTTAPGPQPKEAAAGLQPKARFPAARVVLFLQDVAPTVHVQAG